MILETRLCEFGQVTWHLQALGLNSFKEEVKDSTFQIDKNYIWQTTINQKGLPSIPETECPSKKKTYLWTTTGKIIPSVTEELAAQKRNSTSKCPRGEDVAK